MLMGVVGVAGFSSLLEPLWGPKEFLVCVCMRLFVVVVDMNALLPLRYSLRW